MNKKDRKNTIHKHFEISQDVNTILKNITKAINQELDGKYYEWQIFEVAMRLFQSQLKLMDNDRKREIFAGADGGQ